MDVEIPVITLKKGMTPDEIPHNYSFIVAANGFFIKKKNDFYSILQKVENIDQLEKVDPFVRLNFKKFPQDKLSEIVQFFTDVYDKFDGEAVVLLYYNSEKEEWTYLVPPQEVSRAGVDYKLDDEFKKKIPSGSKLLGSIHSHAEMAAFHSGTDDKDEISFDGLHITIGNVDMTPTFSARYIVSGTEVRLRLKDVVAIPEAQYDRKLLEMVSERTGRPTLTQEKKEERTSLFDKTPRDVPFDFNDLTPEEEELLFDDEEFMAEYERRCGQCTF